MVNGDGAGGRIATVLGFTNDSTSTCALPEVNRVTATLVDGTHPDATEGGFFPIGRQQNDVVPGDRVELVLTTGPGACDTSPEETVRNIESVLVRLSDGSSTQVILDPPVEYDCGIFGWRGLGSWD